MKKSLLVLLCFFSILFMGDIFAQNQNRILPEDAPEVDTRIDNMGYWRRAAKEGYVKVAPNVVPPAAIYRGSSLNSRVVLTNDSPDVAVTSQNSTQSENSIFVNPNNNDNVLNSNNSTENPVGNLFGANDFFSFDGGLSWGGELQGAGGENQGDPAAVIGVNGRYFVGQIKNDGQAVAYSDDQGSTWTPAIQVAPGPPGFNSLLDKNHLWIDNSMSSIFNGNLYDAWTNFGGSNDSEIEISVSTNNGESWSSPVNISSAVNAGSHNQGVNINTGPNGEVYVVWTIYDNWPLDENAMGFAKSLDGGSSWEPAIRIIEDIRGIRNTETSKNHRVNSFPSMAVDISESPRKGSIYVVWPNIGVPGTNDGPDIDIYMIKSSDQGNSWSDPIRVNQDPSGLGKEHYFSWITCDPLTGTLSVIYYDDRNVSSSEVEVWVSNSTDGGDTWEDMRVSDVSFTPQSISGLATGYFGDYLGINARGGKVYPVWTDNRTGTAMTYTSPYTTGLPPNPPMNPYPLSGAQQIEPFTSFHWEDGIGDGDTATSYKFYLGTNYPPNNIINGELISDTFYIPDVTLDNETWYYWRVNSVNDFGSSLGSIWNFTTEAAPSEDFESGDFSANDWQFEGDVDWKIDAINARNGNFSAQSGDVGVGSYSSLKIQLEVIGFGYISFWKKVSSLEGENYLQFLIDGDVEMEWCGDVDWSEESMIISPGTYTFEWRFLKNAASSGDAGWIDYIQFPPIPVLSANAGLNDISCEGIAYQLNATAEYYNSISWSTSGDGIFSDPAILQPTYTAGSMDVETGSAELTITAYNASGDSVSDAMELTINPAPHIFAGEDGTACLPDDYFLGEATAENYTQLWWTSSGDGSFDDTTALNPFYTPGAQDIANGIVSLQMNAKGYALCDDAMSELNITIAETPGQAGTPVGNDDVCQGSMDVVYSTPGATFADTYFWEIEPPAAATLIPDENTVSISFAEDYSGLASLKVKGVNACGEGEFSEMLTIVVNAMPELELGNDTLICVNHVIELDATIPDAVSYLWEPGGATTAIILVDSTGTGTGTVEYSVIATDSHGCVVSDNINITFDPCTGIESGIPGIHLSLYPNPSKGAFALEINTDNQEIITVKLMNALSETLFESKGISINGEYTKEFRLNYLPEGVYYLQIDNGSQSLIRKIMINK